ncbi:MAG: hypothetical protein GYA58_05555 [Anaerolineaceae bacterium]|nr:hypothetical protein [Anaerolineaceae bacterium]
MTLSILRPRKPEAKKSLLINVRVASANYTEKVPSNKGRPWEESEAEIRVASRFVRRAEKASNLLHMSICLSGVASRIDATFPERLAAPDAAGKWALSGGPGREEKRDEETLA